MNHIYTQPQFGEDWFNFQDLYLKMISVSPNSSIFVEVGSWKGKSSSFMAVEIANSSKNIEFFCVDTWLGSPEHKNQNLENLYDTFITNMKPLENLYKHIKSNSVEASKSF